MALLEKDIERRVCQYAESKGALHYKFTSPMRRSVPDRLFINCLGHVWFAEFKREGQKPTVPQQREIDRLRAQGVTVFVIDSVSSGFFMVDMMV